MEIEEIFENLDNIISVLEDKDTSLEKAFSEYEKGIKLIKEANNSLNNVEKKILILQENAPAESVDEDEC